jgi:hypothetical protein
MYWRKRLRNCVGRDKREGESEGEGRDEAKMLAMRSESAERRGDFQFAFPA